MPSIYSYRARPVRHVHPVKPGPVKPKAKPIAAPAAAPEPPPIAASPDYSALPRYKLVEIADERGIDSEGLTRAELAKVLESADG